MDDVRGGAVEEASGGASEPPTVGAYAVVMTMAGLVVVVAGLRAAAPILVPILFSIFVAIIVAPSVRWLQRRGVGTAVALLVVIAAMTLASIAVTTLVVGSIAEFLGDLPVYRQRLLEMKLELLAWLNRVGFETPSAVSRTYLDTDRLLNLVAGLTAQLAGVVSGVLLILVTVIFLVLEASDFRAKLCSLPGGAEEALRRVGRIITDVQQYMAIKTWISLLTGLLVIAWLWPYGVAYPLLWGLIAFLFNYIPNIGSVIAAIPPVLVALVQLGPGGAVYTAVGFLLVNAVVGYGIEPRMLGRGLGLSTLVVWLSLIFWGWVLGPAGMLLSVPLTMVVMIALESSPETRWIALMLGAGPAPPAVGSTTPAASDKPLPIQETLS